MIQIKRGLAIPEDELTFSASRSSGPGGQNVNKVSSRITLQFDVAHSPSLSDGQRALIRERLATRINKEGILRVSSQRHRSQHANKLATIERFAELLHDALIVKPPRKKRRISRAAKERRLDEKKRRSARKTLRSKPISMDE